MLRADFFRRIARDRICIKDKKPRREPGLLPD
jgi:hypothetical protein